MWLWKLILFVSTQLVFAVATDYQTDLNITINTKLLDTTWANPSATGYDFVTEYYYEVGEIVNTECAIQNGSLRMKYSDANHNTLFKTKKMKLPSLSFRSYMKQDRNNSYLDCIYTPKESEYERVYRTYYILSQQNTKYPITIYVNNLEMVHGYWKNSTVVEFQYYYIDGETYSIDCDVEPGHDTYSSTARLDGTTTPRHCGSGDDHITSVIFVSDFTSDALTPRIYGLPIENILYQYRSARHGWTIHYLFKNEETLKLNCVGKLTKFKDFKLRWSYDGTQLQSKQSINDEFGVKSSEKSFILGDGEDMKIIKCQIMNSYFSFSSDIQEVNVILHSKSPVSVNSDTKNSASTANTTLDNDTLEKDTAPDYNAGDSDAFPDRNGKDTDTKSDYPDYNTGTLGTTTDDSTRNADITPDYHTVHTDTTPDYNKDTDRKPDTTSKATTPGYTTSSTTTTPDYTTTSSSITPSYNTMNTVPNSPTMSTNSINIILGIKTNPVYITLGIKPQSVYPSLGQNGDSGISKTLTDKAFSHLFRVRSYQEIIVD